MKRLIRVVAFLLIGLGSLNAHAQRAFSQPELDAMLAPIALYPDPLLTHVLTAAIFPQDVAAAATWSRANPHLVGDDALRAVDYELWHPSVKALVAYPDVLARMAESPQWVADLGEAYSGSYPALAATVQQLRARAEASGYLRSDEQQRVYREAEVIYVQPVYPQVVYAPYYNPYVVYGTWWWPAHRPVYWRPWVAHPIVVTRFIGPHRHHHHHRPVAQRHFAPQRWHAAPQPVHVAPRPVHAAPQPVPIARQPVGVVRPIVTHRPIESRPHRAVPEAQRAPIVQGGPVVRTAPVQHIRSERSSPSTQRAAAPSGSAPSTPRFGFRQKN